MNASLAQNLCGDTDLPPTRIVDTLAGSIGGCRFNESGLKLFDIDPLLAGSDLGKQVPTLLDEVQPLERWCLGQPGIDRSELALCGLDVRLSPSARLRALQSLQIVANGIALSAPEGERLLMLLGHDRTLALRCHGEILTPSNSCCNPLRYIGHGGEEEVFDGAV